MVSAQRQLVQELGVAYDAHVVNIGCSACWIRKRVLVDVGKPCGGLPCFVTDG